MKITVTEKNAVSKGDVDFSALEKLADVTFYDDVKNEDLASVIDDADGVIVNKCLVTASVMDKCPNLKYVGTFATGYNNVDVAAATKRGITVCNVPDYSTDAVAEHTVAFMLMVSSSMPDYLSSVKRGEWTSAKSFCYYPFPISELRGKTVGVYGYGAIGKRVAEICSALKMNVLVCSRSKKTDCPYTWVDSEELFRSADYITFHCPLTDETKGIINEKTLSMMKDTAVVINTARGGLADESAVAYALKNGKIRAYCADVIEREPMVKECLLLGLDNCYLTPHVAWAGVETRARLVNIATENVKAFLMGKPQNKVN